MAVCKKNMNYTLTKDFFSQYVIFCQIPSLSQGRAGTAIALLKTLAAPSNIVAIHSHKYFRGHHSKPYHTVNVSIWLWLFLTTLWEKFIA